MSEEEKNIKLYISAQMLLEVVDELEDRIDKAIKYIKDTPKIVKSIHLRDKESNYIFIENKVKEELLEILEGKVIEEIPQFKGTLEELDNLTLGE